MLNVMSPALAPFYAKLQQQLEEVRKTKRGINAVTELHGQPPPFPEVEQDSAAMTVQRGQFYGQPLALCIKAVLEMRRSAVSDTELFETLKQGGYSFEAKTEDHALNGLRVSLRRNPVFHRIPSGEWGLLSWYPKAKVDRKQMGKLNLTLYQRDEKGRLKLHKTQGRPKLKTGPKPKRLEELARV